MTKTYVMLKPDSVERGLVGNIISRFECEGYQISDIKKFSLTKEILDNHYSHISDKPFYPEIVSFMTRGPVFGMIVEGENVVKGIRDIIGPTNYQEAHPNTIRGKYATSIGENLVHASDSNESAMTEIKRFFGFSI